MTYYAITKFSEDTPNNALPKSMQLKSLFVAPNAIIN